MRKAGEALRRQLLDRTIADVTRDPANRVWWDVVEAFQSQHALPTARMALALGRIASDFALDAPTACIKRPDRIIEKIARSKTGLERLQDIGGCRLVVPDVHDQRSVVQRIIDLDFTVVDIDDYASPRASRRGIPA